MLGRGRGLDWGGMRWTMVDNMDEQRKKEYQTVILAALLHDVGKLLHRGKNKPEYKCSHEQASGEFIAKFYSKLRNNALLYDIDLMKILVSCHDAHITKEAALNDLYFIGKSEENKERVWKMIRIVRDSDSYSCSEREQGDLNRQRTLPLESIFSYATLGEPQRNYSRYHLDTFEPMRAFTEQISELSDVEINNLINRFEENIIDFSRFTSFNDVLITWLNILHEYMWAVPSDTRYKNEISDISLFDHLRGTAAIAACLYKQHLRSLNEGGNFNRKNEFILIGGDFSGIQAYIFDITNRGVGGASKRLRARSFFIYLFSEVTIHKILHALRLPIVCNIFSAGGKFLLLAPNVGEVKEHLIKVKSQIEKEIHETYFAQFAFLMSWKTINVFREEFGVEDFFKTAADMFYALEREKVSKEQSVLIKDHSWNTNDFKATKLYKDYKGYEDCQICGKGPATHDEIDKDEEGRVVKSCFICYRDKIFLGSKIPKSNYIAFAIGNVSKTEEEQGQKIVIFHDWEKGDENNECYYVELLEQHSCKNEYYLTYNVSGANDQQEIITNLVPLKKYYANYVLLDTAKNVEGFEKIAKQSRWEKKEIKYGSDLLGILKADVDNLGLLFNKGFEIPSLDEEGLPDIDRKTVSRFLTLSRMLELFFSGWIKEAMSNQMKNKVMEELLTLENINTGRFNKYLSQDYIDFKNIYTVYSGGDDLVLVGPWETMIIFAIYLNQQFRKYTCNNKFITISAGLTFVKPKYPIASAIKQAEELLDKSKEEGKDRITFFGTTVKWSKLPELMNLFLFLNEKLNDEKSEINISFLHRLLEYHQMALSFLDDNNITGLKFLSALSYDIGRNIVERDKNGAITKGHEEQHVLQALINQKPDRTTLIYNAKVPLFWTLYRNRRCSKDEGISNF